MSLFNAIHESLPYIDQEPSVEQRAAAQALIAAEIPNLEDNNDRLPPPFEPKFSPLIQVELERKAREAATGQKEPLGAIDLSRYEAQEPLDAIAGPSTAASRAKLHSSLAKAYTSYSYLSARRENLDLLDKHGKNAWLLGNYYLESELKALESELAETKRQIDILTVERQRQQDDVAAELRGLEETWRSGVGRMLETEIAAEALRGQVLEQLQQRGQSGTAT